jgi:hypothetical protein
VTGVQTCALPICGERVVDDSFLVLINGPEPVAFRLPDQRWASTYELVIDTALRYTAVAAPAGIEGAVLKAGEDLALEPRSVVVLRMFS